MISFFSSAFALLPSLGSEETERSLKNRKSNHATLLFKMFSEFPGNPESNANVSESCESNLSGSRLKETLPRLEGTRDVSGDTCGCHSWRREGSWYLVGGGQTSFHRSWRGLVTMSGDTCGCHSWRREGSWYLVGGGQTSFHRPCSAQDGSTSRNCPAPNASSVEAEKHYSLDWLLASLRNCI